MNTRTPRTRRLGTIAVLTVLSLLVSPAVAPVQAVTLDAEYKMPSSIVVRGIFGIGKLLCADESIPEVVVETVDNGPCFDYGGHELQPFLIRANDELWALTSITVAVDINGDGCVSDSCSGQPNDADYRVSNCGALGGTLPVSDAAPIMQVFLRVLDVSPDLEVCGATQGTVILDIV